MQQYFIQQAYENPIVIEDAGIIKHMFQVMRLKEGDQVHVVFEGGAKYLARVSDSELHLLEILDQVEDQTELPLSVTIASGFPKGDKLEFLAQKVTELGAQAFWAYPASWSVVKWDAKKLAKKSAKLEKIVQGAGEQSKRNILPQVRLFEQRADFLQELSHFDHIWVAYEETAKSGEKASLHQAMNDLKEGESLLCIFGPEGGLAPEEIALYQEAGARLVGLGPRILRTETAPLYLLSAISYARELGSGKA